ncbi:MAG: hypothetical protein EAZ61_13640 [Oscillatoriales cyanobacterium]|nr:MAG: hypothetical protein EAZ61_13640 [Oscillatoriales cyanobacterium]
MTDVTASQRTLLIGWDAADWKVITPLIDAGKMPNLKRFLDAGVMGNLSTLYPVLSPMLWTSIATGKRAYKHGIHGFSEPDPDTGGVRPISNLSRKTKAIWNILNQEGKRCNVISWWPSDPVEPINGVMVSNHYQEAPEGRVKQWSVKPGTITPERLIEPLAKLRIAPWQIDSGQLRHFVPLAAEVDQSQDRRLYMAAKILSECATVHAAATGVMQNEPWDFMAVYYDSIDHFGHGFMRYHPPRSPWISQRDFELYNGVVEAGYVFHDMMLGTMMDLAGEDTTIMLVSDHGFHPDRLRPQHVPNEPAGPAEEHRPFGIFAMKGPNIAKDKVIFGANLLDVTPTLLAALGLPLGRDMDGKPLLGVFETVPEITWIDSWDEVPGDSGMHPPGMRVDAVDAHAAMQQLVDLGYIEELDTDRETAVANTARELRYNLARDYIGAGQPGNAIPILQELWEQWPEESRFGIKLFNCLLTLDRVPEARSTFEQIIVNKEKYSEIARIELEKFNAELAQKQAENPEFKLDKSGRRRRKKLRARSKLNRPTLEYLRGSLLHAEGQHEAAIKAFNQARGTQLHNRPSLLLRQAEVHLDQRQWLEAESLYNTVLQLDPVNPSAHVGLCQCFLRQRRNEEAIEAGLAALSLIADHPRAHFLTGVALMRCQRYDEAKLALEASLERNPIQPLAHRYLSQLYRKHLGDVPAAQRHRTLAKEARQQLKQPPELAANASPIDPSREIDLDMIPPITDRNGAADIPLQSCISIVSGLPRSGTSMMMQMLAKGGLDAFTDGVREADTNNPRGYYEFELVKNLGRDNSWIDRAQGSVVKIVAPLLPKLPRDRAYRIVFMQRPLSETIASQQKMLERSDRAGGKLTPERLAATFLQQVEAIDALLADYPQVSVLAVNYHDALHDPIGTAQRLADFFDGQLDVNTATTAVDPNLHRERKDAASLSPV